MNELAYLAIALTTLFFNYLIKPGLEQKYPEIRFTMNLMTIAVGITSSLVTVIAYTASGILPVASFYVILPILVMLFISYGIKHGNEVALKMRRVYYTMLIMYSYIFVASAFFMTWALPFMNNIVL